MADSSVMPEEEDLGYRRRAINGPVKIEFLRKIILNKLSNSYKIEAYKGLESKTTLLIVIEVLICVMQISLLMGEASADSFLDYVLNPFLHVYGDFRQALRQDYRTTIVYLYALSLIARTGISIMLVWRSSASRTAVLVIKLLYTAYILEFGLLLIPIASMLCSCFNPEHFDHTVIPAIVCIVLLACQHYLMAPYGHDYGFVKTTKLTHANLTMVASRMLADLFMVVLHECVSTLNNGDSIISVFMIITRVLLLSALVINQSNFNSSAYRSALVLKDSLVVTASLFKLLIDQLSGLINLEAMVFSLFTLIVKLILNMYNRVTLEIIETDVYKLKNSYQVNIKCVSLLYQYEAMLRQEKGSVELQRLMAQHVKSCNVTNCFCRIIVCQFNTVWYESYELKKEIENQFRNKIQNTSKLDKLVFVESGTQVKRALKEQETIDKQVEELTYREYQRKMIRKEKRFHRLKTLLSRDDNISENALVDVVDVTSKHFPAVIYSFLISISERMKDPESSFLLFSYCHFYLRNFVTVLVRGYALMFSKPFQANASAFDMLKLANHLKMSSDALKDETSDSKAWLSSANFVEVFKQIKNIDHCEDLFLKVLEERADLYRTIQTRMASLSSIVARGNSAYLKEAQFSKLIESQLAEFTDRHTVPNTRLLSLSINFRLNISQNPIGLSKLFDMVSRAVRRSKIGFGVDTLRSKKNINLLDNNNVVLLNSIKMTGPSVVYFTRNTPKLFRKTPESILNMNIKELMPPRLKANHDEFILDYVNRRSDRNFEAMPSSGVLIDNHGNGKLVNVIVKIDPIMNDNIYLIGIILPVNNKRKSEFIVYEGDPKPVAFSETLNLKFGELYTKPEAIYNHLPLLIELVNLNFPALFGNDKDHESRSKSGFSHNRNSSEQAEEKIIRATYEALVLEPNKYPDSATNVNLTIVPEKKFTTLAVVKTINLHHLQPQGDKDEPDEMYSPREGSNSDRNNLNLTGSKGSFNPTWFRNQMIPIKHAFGRYLSKHRIRLLSESDSLKTGTLMMSYYQYRRGTSMVIFEIKSVNKLQRNKFRNLVRQMLRSPQIQTYANILMLDVGLIKSICENPEADLGELAYQKKETVSAATENDITITMLIAGYMNKTESKEKANNNFGSKGTPRDTKGLDVSHSVGRNSVRAPINTGGNLSRFAGDARSLNPILVAARRYPQMVNQSGDFSAFTTKNLSNLLKFMNNTDLRPSMSIPRRHTTGGGTAISDGEGTNLSRSPQAEPIIIEPVVEETEMNQVLMDLIGKIGELKDLITSNGQNTLNINEGDSKSDSLMSSSVDSLQDLENASNADLSLNSDDISFQASVTNSIKSGRHSIFKMLFNKRMSSLQLTSMLRQKLALVYNSCLLIFMAVVAYVIVRDVIMLKVKQIAKDLDEMNLIYLNSMEINRAFELNDLLIDSKTRDPTFDISFYFSHQRDMEHIQEMVTDFATLTFDINNFAFVTHMFYTTLDNTDAYFIPVGVGFMQFINIFRTFLFNFDGVLYTPLAADVREAFNTSFLAMQYATRTHSYELSRQAKIHFDNMTIIYFVGGAVMVLFAILFLWSYFKLASELVEVRSRLEAIFDKFELRLLEKDIDKYEKVLDIGSRVVNKIMNFSVFLGKRSRSNSSSHPKQSPLKKRTSKTDGHGASPYGSGREDAKEKPKDKAKDLDRRIVPIKQVSTRKKRRARYDQCMTLITVACLACLLIPLTLDPLIFTPNVKASYSDHENMHKNIMSSPNYNNLPLNEGACEGLDSLHQARCTQFALHMTTFSLAHAGNMLKTDMLSEGMKSVLMQIIDIRLDQLSSETMEALDGEFFIFAVEESILCIGLTAVWCFFIVLFLHLHLVKRGNKEFVYTVRSLSCMSRECIQANRTMQSYFEQVLKHFDK